MEGKDRKALVTCKVAHLFLDVLWRTDLEQFFRHYVHVLHTLKAKLWPRLLVTIVALDLEQSAEVLRATVIQTKIHFGIHYFV